MAILIPIRNPDFEKLRKSLPGFGQSVRERRRATLLTQGFDFDEEDPEEPQEESREERERAELARRQAGAPDPGSLFGTRGIETPVVPSLAPTPSPTTAITPGPRGFPGPFPSSQVSGPSLSEGLFTNIPEGGHRVTPPIAGIIPSGTSFADMMEVYNLPFTLLGGELVDAVTNPNLVDKFTQNPIDEAIETIKRQQSRGFVTRAVSEGLIDFGIPGLLASGARGIGGATRALAKQRVGSELGPNHAAQLRVLMDEFGLSNVAASNEFAAPLLNFNEVLEEVTTNTKLSGQVAAFLGVNPSVIRETSVGRSITAYQRQIVATEELTSVTVAAVLDAKVQRFTGRTGILLPIDNNGFFADTGKLWQDVFSKPDDFNLSTETRALVDDYNQVTNVEVGRILDDVGIDQRIRERPSNEYYVPRNVEEIRGIESRRGSDPNLQRHYEEATEGFDQGIRYSNSPRATMEFHLRWAYRKAAKKQLDDALEPLSITAKDLVPQHIKDIYSSNMVIKRKAEQLRRRIRKGIVVGEANLRTSRVRLGERGRNLSQVQADIESMDNLIISLDVLPRELETIRPAGRKTRVGITPETLRRERIRNISKAKQARDEYRSLVKREGVKTARFQTAERLNAKIQARMDILTEHLAAVDLQLPGIRNGYGVSKNNYTRALEEARKAETVRPETPAGKFFSKKSPLFGKLQTNDIAIADWHNRFFTRADADLLKTALEQQRPKGVSATKGFEILGNTIRTLAATGDFAMPFIQGLPVLAENPVAWGRMTLRHYQAFFDPSVGSRLIRENIVDYQWLARHQVPIGDPEFFAALNPGEGVSAGALLEKLPRGEEVRRFAGLAGRQTFGRFQASYNAGLGYSRLLIYQGLKDTWKGTDAELAQYIRNLTGGLDSRALGVGPNRRAAEGIWMAFSPRLLRSTVALVKDALNPRTEVGRKALRNLARLLTGATLVYVLTGIALGKDWKEIGVGLNPLSGKRFVSHEVNGDWIGFGGQVRAIVQLIAGITAGLVTEPQSLVSLDRFENPIIKFLAGRGAPGVEIAGALIEGFTGLDALPYDEVDGPIDLIKHIGTSMTFFAIQGKMEGENNLTVLAALGGARTSAQTQSEKVKEAQRTVMKREGIEGTFQEQDRNIRADINADSLVIKAREIAAKDQTKKKRDVQLYLNAVKQVNEGVDTLIKESAEQLGPGRAFRAVLPNHQTKRVIQLESVRGEERHSEAIQFFDELEPKETQIDIATTDYFDKLEAGNLDNEITGEYDFEKRDEILSSLRSTHGDDVIDEVERLNRLGEHPLVTELREDRETLRPYWDQIDIIVEGLPLEVQKVYRGFQELSPTDRVKFSTSAPGDSKAQSDKKEQNRLIINEVDDRIAKRLEKVLFTNSSIRDALLKWEYKVTRRLIRIQAAEELGAK